MTNRFVYNAILIDVYNTPAEGVTPSMAKIRFAYPCKVKGKSEFTVVVRAFHRDGRIVELPPNANLAAIREFDLAGFDSIGANS